MVLTFYTAFVDEVPHTFCDRLSGRGIPVYMMHIFVFLLSLCIKSYGEMGHLKFILQQHSEGYGVQTVIKVTLPSI